MYAIDGTFLKKWSRCWIVCINNLQNAWNIELIIWNKKYSKLKYSFDRKKKREEKKMKHMIVFKNSSFEHSTAIV